jgi:hypothetical protein
MIKVPGGILVYFYSLWYAEPIKVETEKLVIDH